MPPEKPRRGDLPRAPWKPEWEILRELGRAGHDVRILGVLDSVNGIRRIAHQWRPHIVFNLLEEFDGEALFDQNVVAFLELAGIRYTGCNPRGLMLARHKGLAKMILAHQGIPTPRFEVVPRGMRPSGSLPYPCFVKSATEEASLGVSQSSIARTPKALRDRVAFIHEAVGSDAIVEEYIDGRELYVGVLGNGRPETLPVWELKFRSAPPDLPRIATRRVKFDPVYQKKYGITSGVATSLSRSEAESIQALCRRAYRILGLNGYARLDLRRRPDGEVFLLEANPNPHIGKDEDFACSARRAGLSYRRLLERILRLGLGWEPRRWAA